MDYRYYYETAGGADDRRRRRPGLKAVAAAVLAVETGVTLQGTGTAALMPALALTCAAAALAALALRRVSGRAAVPVAPSPGMFAPGP